MKRLFRLLPLLGLIMLLSGSLFAQQAPHGMSLKLDMGGAQDQTDLSVGIQLVFAMTILALAPTLIILMTSFTRIVIVLGFVRNALGVQQAPANQIIIGLSLFLTLFLMGPVTERIYSEAAKPYMDGKMQSTQAIEFAADQLKGFMLRQTRASDVEFFLEIGGFGKMSPKELPLRVVTPAFVLSELRTAFQMGFLIFIPFIVIDFLVASILMAMGMMMMPPVVLSLPFKLLLFVLVDGWTLVVRSLIESFRM